MAVIYEDALKGQIKSGVLSPVYIILGEDDFLKRMYVDKITALVADKDAALENMGVQNAIAEAEAALAGEGRVLVRKSGTESVIRVLAEAPDQAAADAAMKRIANALEAL